MDSELTAPTLHIRKSPNMTCELPVTSLIKLTASQLELYHPLSNSAGNSMAITLYWLKSQSVCTHPGTVTLSTQIRVTLQKSNDKYFFFLLFLDESATFSEKCSEHLFVSENVLKTCLCLLYEIHALNWRNIVFFLTSFALLLLWNSSSTRCLLWRGSSFEKSLH